MTRLETPSSCTRCVETVEAPENATNAPQCPDESDTAAAFDALEIGRTVHVSTVLPIGSHRTPQLELPVSVLYGVYDLLDDWQGALKRECVPQECIAHVHTVRHPDQYLSRVFLTSIYLVLPNA